MSSNTLFPTFDVPDIVTRKEDQTQRYRKSAAWDIEKGDFVRDGIHRIVTSNGRDTFIQWCYKIANTQRYAHLAYPAAIGVEMIQAVGEPEQKAVESAIERTITEALLVNPRTEYVREFKFNWNGDSVYCECAVKGREWEEFQLKLNINKEEVENNDT